MVMRNYVFIRVALRYQIWYNNRVLKKRGRDHPNLASELASMQMGFVPGTKREKIGNLIKKIYCNTAPLFVGEAILFTVAGVLMLLHPVDFLPLITFGIGVVLTLFGLYRVSMAFVSNLGFGIGTFDVFFGLVTLILGVVFCVFPHGASIGIMYVFTVLFFFTKDCSTSPKCNSHNIILHMH